MARDGKAFWYKDGQIIEVGSRHIIDVCNNAEVFGLTKEYIKSIYDLYSEEWGSEGKAREEIMIQLMEDGWIRVRESIDREGSKWTLQFDDYKKRKKELQEIVSQLLFDREDMKNFDSLVLLQCDGNFYKMYDTWKTNTKPSDFLAEGMNKKKKMAKMVYSYDDFLKKEKENG